MFPELSLEICKSLPAPNLAISPSPSFKPPAVATPEIVAAPVTSNVLPSKVRPDSPSKVFAVPDPVISRLSALLLIVVPDGTDCQEQVPSPSSLRNLVAPDSPVDNIAVPSGVAEIVCQLRTPEPSLLNT